MKKYDVIIIGGGPSGIIVGLTAKKLNPQKSFLMIKEEEKGLIPCGIPYIFHDLGSVDKNVMGYKPFVNAGGEILVDTVTNVDVKEKQIATSQGEIISYGKLIFATGSRPKISTFIKGHELEGVEYISKSFNDISLLKNKVDKAEKIVIIGGGFIGVEVAEQLSKHTDKKISLIEKEAYCLSRAFSEDLCKRADELLRKTAINLKTGIGVAEILGKDNKVTGVKLEDGTIIDAEIVISSIGYIPNSELAKKAEIRLNSRNAILVDNYLRTSVVDVFAIGDCSSTRGFITGRNDDIMLASTATAESRILGYNLFKIRIKRGMAGTISVFSTELNGRAFASVGAIEKTATDANVDFVSASFEDVDTHPGTFDKTNKLSVKLIVLKGDGSIIGGEICGGKSIGELINVIALAIQKSVTVYELVSFQVGTHPLLTSAPTKYVLIKTAELAMQKLNS